MVFRRKQWQCKGQFYLGTCYDNGYGITKDIAEAFNWYLKAARKGKMEAQFNIGYFYDKGELVRKNFKKAVHWYSLAAKQGDTEAQRDLGYCYFYARVLRRIKQRQFCGTEKPLRKRMTRLFTT
ncbi:MAG TPA: tetratricopeptide repeat protein [Cyclobacteriaceae bacterium]|nr:tetratricopeptide repeat protein [Cyclobacteriaceae bacterium]